MGYATDILALSPLAYWRVGETSGTGAADSSGHGYGGTYVATGLTLGVTGAIPSDTDTGISFNGTAGDKVDYGNRTELKVDHYATINFWVKSSAFGSGFRWLLQKNGVMGLQTYNNVVCAYSWGNNETHYSTTNIADGAWHMLTLSVHLGTSATNDNFIYVDGHSVLTVDMIRPNSQDWIWGFNDGYSIGQQATCVTDEHAVFDYQLSDAQVHALYMSGLAQFVTSAGVASAEALGTPSVGRGPVNVTGAGVASAEAIGTSVITTRYAITAVGNIASAEALGTPSVGRGPVNVTGAGVASAEALGASTVTPGAVNLTGAGVASAEALGASTVTPGAVNLTGAGVASAEVLGVTVVTPGAVNVSLASVDTAEALGASTVTPGAVSLTGTGIGSAEALGTSAVTTGPVSVTGAGVASAEAIGTSAVTSTYPITNAGNIPSEAVVGGLTVTYSYPITNAGRIPTQEALGATVLRATYPITGVGGVSTAEAIGTPTVLRVGTYIRPEGIGTGENFGQTAVGQTAGKLTVVSDGLAALIRASSLVRNVYPMPMESVTPTCAVIGFPTKIDYDLTFNCAIVGIDLPIWFVVGQSGARKTRDDLSVLIDSIKTVLDGDNGFGIVSVTKATIDHVNIGQLSFMSVRFNVDITD
jgi:hypothetical protein